MCLRLNEFTNHPVNARGGHPPAIQGSYAISTDERNVMADSQGKNGKEEEDEDEDEDEDKDKDKDKDKERSNQLRDKFGAHRCSD